MAASILLDSNLLLLLIVGKTSPDLVEKHKKTTAFKARDFQLLVEIIDGSEIVILPNVASETSNLLAFHKEPKKERLFQTFATLVEGFTEIFVPSSQATEQREFVRLGITDAALLSAGAGRRLLAADAVLCAWAGHRGLDVVNFNHLRDAWREGGRP